MNVALILSEFPALSETFVLDHITGLIDRGHDVEIYAFEPSVTGDSHPEVSRYGLIGRTRYRPSLPNSYALRLLKAIGLFLVHGWRRPVPLLRSLNLHRFGRDAARLLLFYAAIPHLTRRKYDIVHAHFGANGVLAINLRAIGVLEGPLVTTFHGADITRQLEDRGAAYYARLFSGGELFLTVSRLFKRKLIGAGCDASRIKVHHVGVDCTAFSFREPRPSTDEPLRLLSIGRLVEKKGTEFAIRAVALLRERQISVNYDIVGGGPRAQPLQRLTENLDAVEVIQLLGPRARDEVLALLQESDILIAPSVTAADGDKEGIPVVLMEAMATGLPVISTLHSGIPELVEHGVSGLLVPERDVTALRDALVELVRHPELRPTLARAARARVQADFDIETLNDQLVRYYRSLIEAEGRLS